MLKKVMMNAEGKKNISLLYLVCDCEKSGPAGADLGLELAVLRHVRVPGVKSTISPETKHTEINFFIIWSQMHQKLSR